MNLGAKQEACVNIFMSFFLGPDTQSSLWKAVAFFLESIALQDISAAEKCFGARAAGERPSPQEGERYNYSKCTAVVRVLEFCTTLLGISTDAAWKVGSRPGFLLLDLAGPLLWCFWPSQTVCCYGNYLFIFFFFGAAPTAYGGSQARGLIGAVATSLHQRHSNTGSELRLRPRPQRTATPDP